MTACALANCLLTNLVTLSFRWGGRLTRHNLHIQQLGPDTVTDVATFYLAGRSQLHDLHSSLYLDHPRGQSNQLHKCIVTHATGKRSARIQRFKERKEVRDLAV